jgi:serine protease Do
MSRWSMPCVCLVIGGVGGSFVASPLLRGQNQSQAPVATAIPKEMVSYRDVVKKVLPAVVSIEGRAKKGKVDKPTARRRSPLEDSPQVPEELRKFLEEMEKRQGDQEDVPQLGFGSGFLVDPKGVILTNFHVVDGADEVQVTLKDGRKYTSKDIHGDRKTDLAIVRIESKTALPYLDLGDSDAMEIGDRVLAVGAPFGLTGSVTSGIVSAKGRSGLRMNMYEDFLQTDAAINPGNSGGPLVNLAGQVVGINSAIKSRTGGFQGVGLAIASNLAKNIEQQLLTNGVVHRGYLGIQIRDLDPEVATRLGLKDQEGVLVGQVFESSPAAKAGVQPGDVVVSIGGKSLKDGRQLQNIVAGLPLGKPVDIAVVRDGKSQILSVTIHEQPNEFGSARGTLPKTPRRNQEGVKLEKIGVEVTDLNAETAEKSGYKDKTSGVLVTSVEEDSPAASAGLARGMLIVKADKHPVTSAKAFGEMVNKAALDQGLLLQVESPNGGINYLMVKAETAK